MQVLNVHRRDFAASADEAGRLLDTLASANDLLWPGHVWPRMKLDRPLGIGAAGGHGPIRYAVEEYSPGARVRFRFSSPRGFDGWHELRVVANQPAGCGLVHVLSMRTSGAATLLWPLIFRPLHDALLEDALSKAQASLGEVVRGHPWSMHVKLLRWFMTRGKPMPRRAA